ncbi:MAG: arsenate reductase (glutaredoxin) [Alphaproteobacteria bacterium]|nr:MAG: arsenate reductase (glutaredoxin) [Alphaproteobacteria bacterium]
MSYDLRPIAAEVLGTALLVATVVGSGIMADRLTDDPALALLGNTVPTGAILVVLILMLGPISGAHFNPVVTLLSGIGGQLPRRQFVPYVAAQVSGGVLGVVVANMMFDLAPLALSTTTRSGIGQWLSEVVATSGLVLVILLGQRRPADVPWTVGLYITAAYWFTASTSFANPAVTIARSLTDTFSGIRPADVLPFVGCQIVGALAAYWLVRWFRPPTATETVTIYHNPECGTSRNTLAMIRQSGVEPEVIEYLHTPPARDRLVWLINEAGLTVREALRKKDTPYEALGLDRADLTDADLLDAVAEHPILINRPFVVTPLGVRLCRPSEAVLDILQNPEIGPFIKEDGEVVIDASGKRLV